MIALLAGDGEMHARISTNPAMGRFDPPLRIAYAGERLTRASRSGIEMETQSGLAGMKPREACRNVKPLF
jgi:hypothetical protein